MNIKEEIKNLHQSILDDRRRFDEGMKSDLAFGDLRLLFTEIKRKEKELEVLFVESAAIQDNDQ